MNNRIVLTLVTTAKIKRGIFLSIRSRILRKIGLFLLVDFTCVATKYTYILECTFSFLPFQV